MNEIVKILVVDDHPLVGQATKNVLEQIEHVEVIGVMKNGESCIEFVQAHEPHIVFLDYHLPDTFGTQVAEQIKTQYPHIHVVIFTGKDISDLINTFIEIKVSGIISKEASEGTIKNMVHCILDNHTVIPLSLFTRMRVETEYSAMESALTEDEMLIMSLIVKGDTHEQIADQIHMSKRSVDNYLKKIYGKMGVKTKIQAIEKFVQSRSYAQMNKGGPR